MDQVATVEVRDQLHTGWQLVIIQLLDLLVERIERGIGLCTFAQKDDTLNHVVVIDDVSVLIANGFAELTQAYFWRLHDDRKIAYPDGGAVLHFYDRGRDVIRSLHQANRAHIQCLLAALNE